MTRRPITLLCGALAFLAVAASASIPILDTQSATSAGVETSSAPVPLAEPRIVASQAPFRDKFGGFDPDLWKISDGWRNGRWTANDWRRSQAVIDDGLTMTLEAEPSKLADYAGAEIQSRRRFGHGYFEVRMRAAKASGTVSGFFTYTGPPFGDPWNEIDVEILGRKPREVMFTYFRDGKKTEHRHTLDFDATEGFHTYGFDWQPEHLRWYVDGDLAHEASPAELALPNLPQKLMTSLWGSETLTSWVGPLRQEALPTTMEVACISYSKDYASRTPC